MLSFGVLQVFPKELRVPWFGLGPGWSLPYFSFLRGV